jgi:hypothetical protein
MLFATKSMRKLFHMSGSLSLYFPTPNLNHQQVHYHIIPAPKFNSLPTGLDPKDLKQELPLTTMDMHRKEYELRDDLDEDDAHALVEKIKTHL